jgi:DNA-binding FrmR family transcriptional regulator
LKNQYVKVKNYIDIGDIEMSDMNSNGHHHDHNHDEGGHTHTHQHSHQHTKQVLNRLAKATGHLQSVSRMVENGRDCSEVLIQLSAVIAALNSTGKIILDDHIDTCIVDAVHNGDKDAIENLKVAIDRFVK